MTLAATAARPATAAPDRAAMLAAATGCHTARDLTAAETGYRDLIQADPGDSDAVYYLGIIAFQNGRPEQAMDLIGFALKSARFSPTFEPTLARLLEGQGGAPAVEVRTFLRRNRLEPHILSGKLGGVLNLKEIEPWYFTRRMNPYPRRMEDFDDLEALIDKYVLKGWLPPEKPFGPGSQLLTLGSCFAAELRKYLAEHEHESRLIFVPPGLNNTFALRQFIDWSLTGNASTDAYWYDEHALGGAVKWAPTQEQEAYKRVFSGAEGIVLTIGLAEVWYDRETGGVFWRGVPKQIFDENIHTCRVSTVEENAANIRTIVRLIRGQCGNIPIILTLSPVPLKATFGDTSCMTADCVSKSILRVAIDQVMGEAIEGVHYWPSFEIVKWLGCHLATPMYGDDGNTRHVSRPTVGLILDAFMRHYFAAKDA